MHYAPYGLPAGALSGSVGRMPAPTSAYAVAVAAAQEQQRRAMEAPATAQRS